MTAQKYEWRKKEKAIYFPKNQPEFIQIPSFQFLTISGEGNPNNEAFGEYIAALYALSYGLKMTLKKEDQKPAHYQDFTVYPLEGIWDIREEARSQFNGKINKDDLVFKLMIRQPDFISPEIFKRIRKEVQKKKPNKLIPEVQFETIEEGPCIQMMHLGSYDSEPESFRQMESFGEEKGYPRLSKIHREIYLSDFKKVAPEKLKTVLRYRVKG